MGTCSMFLRILFYIWDFRKTFININSINKHAKLLYYQILGLTLPWTNHKGTARKPREKLWFCFKRLLSIKYTFEIIHRNVPDLAGWLMW